MRLLPLAVALLCPRCPIRCPAPRLIEERPRWSSYQRKLNINEAGPDEERQAQIASLMGKLRREQRVGDSTSISEAKSVLKPQAQPPPQTTSGIGGSWSPSVAEAPNATFKPKVATWGVFDRPADISKAYGGGRKIGVGGYAPPPEEVERKRAETQALLANYRKSVGADLEAEKAHQPEIEAALKEAQQLLRFGSTKGALAELQGVQGWCTTATELGSRTLLELGLALVANAGTAAATEAEREESRADANRIFKSLGRSPSEEVRRVAQQMLFQETAQEFLKVGEAEATSEWSKVGRIGSVGGKRYALADAYLSSPKRRAVDSLPEARTVLRSAAVGRSDRGAPQRILQSLEFLDGLPAEQRAPEGRAAAEAAMRGQWLLGLSVDAGGALSFPPEQASQTVEKVATAKAGADLAGGGQAGGYSFERLAPSRGLMGLSLLRSRGTLRVVIEPERSGPGGGGPPGAAAQPTAEPTVAAPPRLSLRLDVRECSLGPLPLPPPARTVDERVLLLDPIMCIVRAEGTTSVWVRPVRVKG